VHQLAQSAALVISLLAHSRTITLWVRDRSRQRLNCSVLRELARTGGTVREERRTRTGTLLTWELRLPERRTEPDPPATALRGTARSERPRHRRCAVTVRAAGRPSRTGGAGGGR
jgi:hypothetical protein